MAFNSEISDFVYNKICEGWTLVRIAKKLKVSRQAIYHWANAFPEFKKRMQDARHIQIENFMDEIIEISDNENIDTARAALKIRARKILSKYRKPDTKKKESNQPHVFLGLSVVPPKLAEKEINNVGEKMVESTRQGLLPKPK